MDITPTHTHTLTLERDLNEWIFHLFAWNNQKRERERFSYKMVNWDNLLMMIIIVVVVQKLLDLMMMMAVTLIQNDCFTRGNKKKMTFYQ